MYHQVIRQVERGYMNNSAMFPVKSIDCGAFIQKKVEPLGLGGNGLVDAVLGIVRVGNSCAYSWAEIPTWLIDIGRIKATDGMTAKQMLGAKYMPADGEPGMSPLPFVYLLIALLDM